MKDKKFLKKIDEQNNPEPLYMGESYSIKEIKFIENLVKDSIKEGTGINEDDINRALKIAKHLGVTQDETDLTSTLKVIKIAENYYKEDLNIQSDLNINGYDDKNIKKITEKNEDNIASAENKLKKIKSKLFNEEDLKTIYNKSKELYFDDGVFSDKDRLDVFNLSSDLMKKAKKFNEPETGGQSK